MTSSNEYWLFHWTLVLGGGVFALLTLGWHWWIEDGKAISYFASLRGEDVDFSKIINRSSWFIGRVVRLEQKRRTDVEQALRKLKEIEYAFMADFAFRKKKNEKPV